MTSDTGAGPTRRHVLLGLFAASAPRAQAAPELTLRPWPRGRPTPVLALPAWDGAPWSLAAQRGQPLLLNFWASWCEPCRAEMPSLEALADRHAADGLRVFAVNFREGDAAVRRFVDGTGLRLPVLRDRDGSAARAFGVTLFPSTVGVDRRGRVKALALGEVDWATDAAQRWVRTLL